MKPPAELPGGRPWKLARYIRRFPGARRLALPRTSVAATSWPVTDLLLFAILTVAVALGPLIDILQYVMSAGPEEPSHVSQLLRGAMMAGMALGLAARPRASRHRGLVLPIVLLGGYGILASSARGHTSDGVVFCVRIAFLGVVYGASYDLARRRIIAERWATRVAWTVLLTVLASQAVGRVLGISSYEIAFDFPGYTGEPSLIAGSVFAVFAFFFLRAIPRSSDALGAALAIASIAATQRRSAVVAVFAATALFCIHTLMTRGPRVRSRFAGALLVLIVAGTVFAALTPLGRELTDRFTDATAGTASGRKIFQQIAISRIMTRGAVDTLFGEGFGPIKDLMARQFGAAIGAHNDWLDLVFALGLIGAGLFLFLHVRLLTATFTVDGPYRRAMQMAVVALVVMEFTAGAAFDATSAPFYAMFGLLAGLRRPSGLLPSRRGRPVTTRRQASRPPDPSRSLTRRDAR